MSKFQFYFETMAGTHLGDSVRALRDAGSPDALYDPSLRATDPNAVSCEDVSLARDEAMGWRVTYCRRVLLFAAFAAEAYANDFLHEKWGGQDRDALRKLSTVDKYAILPALAGATRVLDRGREPLQRIKWLFERRNELVHAVPRDDRDLTWDPTNHNPLDAAMSIVAVADAATTLTEEVPDASVLSYVLAERQGLLEYGKRAAGELPDIHDPPSPVDLLSDARRRDWSLTDARVRRCPDCTSRRCGRTRGGGDSAPVEVHVVGARHAPVREPPDDAVVVCVQDRRPRRRWPPVLARRLRATGQSVSSGGVCVSEVLLLSVRCEHLNGTQVAPAQDGGCCVNAEW